MIEELPNIYFLHMKKKMIVPGQSGSAVVWGPSVVVGWLDSVVVVGEDPKINHNTE